VEMLNTDDSRQSYLHRDFILPVKVIREVAGLLE
jgi:hypothetical protein